MSFEPDRRKTGQLGQPIHRNIFLTTDDCHRHRRIIHVVGAGPVACGNQFDDRTGSRHEVFEPDRPIGHARCYNRIYRVAYRVYAGEQELHIR